MVINIIFLILGAVCASFIIVEGIRHYCSLGKSESPDKYTIEKSRRFIICSVLLWIFNTLTFCFIGLNLIL